MAIGTLNEGPLHAALKAMYAANGGEEEVYCASADWMDRNFFRRIEIMYPIRDPEIKQRLIGDLDLYLADNTQAWQLTPNGEYELVTHGADAPVSAQSTLLSRLGESV